MARYRVYSIEFKRQVVRELLSGEESLLGLSKRHRLSRNLIRLWARKYEAGEFNEDAVVASTLKESEARIAALERKVGQLTMENDLLKKSLPHAASPSVVSSSVISGPLAFPARKDVGS
jgi:transposase-like protein